MERFVRRARTRAVGKPHKPLNSVKPDFHTVTWQLETTNYKNLNRFQLTSPAAQRLTFLARTLWRHKHTQTEESCLAARLAREPGTEARQQSTAWPTRRSCLVTSASGSGKVRCPEPLIILLIPLLVILTFSDRTNTGSSPGWYWAWIVWRQQFNSRRVMRLVLLTAELLLFRLPASSKWSLATNLNYSDSFSTNFLNFFFFNCNHHHLHHA